MKEEHGLELLSLRGAIAELYFTYSLDDFHFEEVEYLTKVPRTKSIFF
jgi:hypothetical protein